MSIDLTACQQVYLASYFITKQALADISDVPSYHRIEESCIFLIGQHDVTRLYQSALLVIVV